MYTLKMPAWYQLTTQGSPLPSPLSTDHLHTGNIQLSLGIDLQVYLTQLHHTSTGRIYISMLNISSQCLKQHHFVTSSQSQIAIQAAGFIYSHIDRRSQSISIGYMPPYCVTNYIQINQQNPKSFILTPSQCNYYLEPHKNKNLKRLKRYY